ncbi:hypothetical protein, partial [Caballeronia sp. AAUFL_F1_KS47]|uniref:hypothetical protein n=1 Tax=Caballeronia sp. AAUFL_F1_KS47 TaxID=2921771 RepID=UPI0020284E0A
MHTYPAHPALIRSYDNSQNWVMEKKGGTFSSASGNRLKQLRGEFLDGPAAGASQMGGRPCAMFSFAGQPMDKKEASRLLA